MQVLVTLRRGSSDYADDSRGFRNLPPEYLGIGPMLQMWRLRPGVRLHRESTAELGTLQSWDHTPQHS